MAPISTSIYGTAPRPQCPHNRRQDRAVPAVAHRDRNSSPGAWDRRSNGCASAQSEGHRSQTPASSRPRGLSVLYVFSALGGDTGYGLVSDRFVEYARSGRPYPADDAAYVSPALQTLGNIVARMRAGLDRNLVTTRPVTLASITDTHDHVQIPGRRKSSPSQPV